jgi:hypothetical protein
MQVLLDDGRERAVLQQRLHYDYVPQRPCRAGVPCPASGRWRM